MCSFSVTSLATTPCAVGAMSIDIHSGPNSHTRASAKSGYLCRRVVLSVGTLLSTRTHQNKTCCAPHFNIWCALCSRLASLLKHEFCAGVCRWRVLGCLFGAGVFLFQRCLSTEPSLHHSWSAQNGTPHSAARDGMSVEVDPSHFVSTDDLGNLSLVVW